VAVGGIGVAVGGTSVAVSVGVGGSGVTVGGTGVAVGGTGVAISVGVGGSEVTVGDMGVAVGGWETAVGGTDVATADGVADLHPLDKTTRVITMPRTRMVDRLTFIDWGSSLFYR
jgi:hypothetical protein